MSGARTRLFFPRGAAAAVLFWASAALGAVPDWVRMTATEPVSDLPNEAALVLLDSSQIRFLTATSVRAHYRGAVRVTTANGRGLARAHLTYDPDYEHVVSARAWIMSADGKKVRTYDRAEFVDSVAQLNNYFWYNERLLTFDASPLVEVGGTLLWEFELESPDIDGVTTGFHSNRYLVHGRLEAIPVPGGTIEWSASTASLRPPTPGSEPGALCWETSGRAPHPLGRPTGFLPNPLAISVRCRPPGAAAAPLHTWPELAAFASNIVAPRLEADATVRAEAARLTAGKTQRWDRIRALSEFVQRDIVYLSITLDKDQLAGYRPHAPAEVLRQRFGDCKDKAALLIALLRASGESGYMVLAAPDNRIAVRPEWPSLPFDHAIVALPADAEVPASWPTVDGGPLGRLAIFDPTDPNTPLGVLPQEDQGGFGLVLAADGRLLRLPTSAPEFTKIDRQFHNRLDAAGGLVSEAEEEFHGLAAAQAHALRIELGEEKFGHSLESVIHRATPLARDVRSTSSWDAPSAHYHLHLQFAADNFLEPISDNSFLLRPALLDSPLLSPWRTQAEGVVWLPAESVDEESHFALPAGYRAEELPDAVDAHCATASCHISYRAENGALVFHFTLQRTAGFRTKAEYEELRLFHKTLRDARRRPIVLNRAARP